MASHVIGYKGYEIEVSVHRPPKQARYAVGKWQVRQTGVTIAAGEVFREFDRDNDAELAAIDYAKVWIDLQAA